MVVNRHYKDMKKKIFNHFVILINNYNNNVLNRHLSFNEIVFLPKKYLVFTKDNNNPELLFKRTDLSHNVNFDEHPNLLETLEMELHQSHFVIHKENNRDKFETIINCSSGDTGKSILNVTLNGTGPIFRKYYSNGIDITNWFKTIHQSDAIEKCLQLLLFTNIPYTDTFITSPLYLEILEDDTFEVSSIMLKEIRKTH